MYIQSVGIVVRNQQGLVWAGARADQEDWCWQFPQGTIEKGEAPLEAAKRELWEETGLKADHFEAQSSQWLRYDYPASVLEKLARAGGSLPHARGEEQQWFLYAFKGEDHEIHINHLFPEFKAWKWMRAGELLEHLVSFKKPVIKKILQEFGFFEEQSTNSLKFKHNSYSE